MIPALRRGSMWVVVSVVVTLPWQGTASWPSSPIDLAPQARVSLTAAAPIGMRGARSLAAPTVCAPGVVAVVLPALAAPKSVERIPALDEALAQLLAWVATDQALRAHDALSDEMAHATALTTPGGTPQ